MGPKVQKTFIQDIGKNWAGSGKWQSQFSKGRNPALKIQGKEIGAHQDEYGSAAFSSNSKHERVLQLVKKMFEDKWQYICD